jgi:hypothetical protein
MTRLRSIRRGLRAIAVMLALSATLASGATAETGIPDPPPTDVQAPRDLEFGPDSPYRSAWGAAVCSFAQTLAKFHLGSDAEASQICLFIESLDSR